MLGFGFVELLLQISMNRAKFVGEKYDLESSQVKRVAKQAQQAQSRHFTLSEALQAYSTISTEAGKG